MKKWLRLCAIVLCLTLVLGMIPTGATENYDEDVVFEVHYYMPNNGVEPVVFTPVTYGDLSGREYTTFTFELTPEDCEKYFSAMTQRSSIEFQLRLTGDYGFYVNGISWGFQGETPAKELSGESLKQFFVPEENKAEHTDFRTNSNTTLNSDRLAWSDTEQAMLFKSADSSLLGQNAIWGMELSNVKNSGKTAVISFSVKLDTLKEKEETVFELHYYMPGNGVEPVVFEPVAYEDLSGSEYTTFTFTLSPDDCEKYFAVMNERSSIEFQLRTSGTHGFYINGISWGFQDETPASDLSDDSLKKFFVPEENKAEHTDFRTNSNTMLNSDRLAWSDTEQAMLFKSADSSLLRQNAIWGMELRDVKNSGKTVVLTISAKLEIGEALEGYTLSLDGDIGVNFYMSLSDAVTADSGAYMQFTLPGTNHTEEKVMVSNATKVGDYYVFSCGVAAKDMTGTIKAQIVLSNGVKGTEYTYSVKEYADYIINDTSGTYSAQTVALVKSMLNYGGYTQTQFQYNTENLANADLDLALPEVTALDESYKCSITGSIDGLTYVGSSLLLTTATGIRHYFTVGNNSSIEDYTFTCDGKTLTPVVKDNYYYVEISNIAAKDLGTMYTLQVNEEMYAISYSAYTYAKTVLDGQYADSLKNTMKAIYQYCEDAKIYFDEAAQ